VLGRNRDMQTLFVSAGCRDLIAQCDEALQ